MWCQQCGQDVPVMRTESGAPGACPRCNETSEGHQVDSSAATSPAVGEWQSEQRLKQIGRSLRVPLATTTNIAGEQTVHWLDVAAMNTTGESLHTKRQAEATRRRMAATQPKDSGLQWFAWLTMSVGLGLVVGGVWLVGMALFGEENRFWQWGIGVTLAGQAILIAGLVRALMSLWSNSRRATERMIDMQQQLDAVGRTAESIVAQQAGGSSAFYGELARGSSPTVLMANLKGQLDHLAARMHQNV